MTRLLPALVFLAACSPAGGNANGNAASPPANGAQPATDDAQACVARSGSYEHCVAWGPQEHLRGVWVNAQETSGFIPGATSMPAYADHGWNRVHLDLAATAQPDPLVLVQRNGAQMPTAILIDFDGRHVASPGHYGPTGAPDMVIVDRVVSMRFLGSIPH